MNFKQYKQKKKRAVDPNAPPRPNLLSQDKKLRETMGKLESQDFEVARLKKDLRTANRKIRQLELKIDDVFKVASAHRTR
jgi:predicted RNase H-like nuclease (RuvC/YqgF family)